MKNFLSISAAGLLLIGATNAQETPRFAFNVGGGSTETLGATARRIDPGWNFDAGAGYNFHPYVGLMVQFNYNQLDVNTATVNALGFPAGNVRQWSLTLDPVIHTNPKGPVDVYFIGGGGLYQRRQEFTQATTIAVTGFDPFFGFYQVGLPANQVVASYTLNKPGVNGGMGISFGTKWHVKFYGEARYHRMFLGNDRHTDLLPVTFGLRW